MYGPHGTVIDWPRSILAIWAQRLIEVAWRELGDVELTEAYALAAAEGWSAGWELRSFVPLQGDPHGHRWAVVFTRGAEHPAPNLFFAHGVRPVDGLLRAVKELRLGITLPEPAAETTSESPSRGA